MMIMIQADLEGATGVNSFGQVIPGSTAYPRSCDSLTGDVNAAITGIFAAADRQGSQPVVDVVDGHFHMANLDLERLDPRINSYTAGFERKLLQLEGLDESYDAIFCIGQHDLTGGAGVMAHTWVRWRWAVNGTECTETLLNAYTAGEFGVPLVLVTGDNVLVGKTRDTFEASGSSLETVITKVALGFGTGALLPSQANPKGNHACRLRGHRWPTWGSLQAGACSRPARIDLTVTDAAQAARIDEAFPKVTRTGEATVAWESETFLEAITQGSLVLGVFFDEILTRACQNLVPWYRTALFGPQASR